MNNEEIDPTLTTLRYPATINSYTSFTLEAIDEKGSSSTKRTSINFLNGIYYGKSSIKTIDEITSEFILSLTKSLASSYKKTLAMASFIN